MPDVWEIDNGLNVFTDDRASDLDEDGVSNIDEFTIGTIVYDPDSDSDGLEDGFELDAINHVPVLDPLVNNSALLQTDFDTDGLTLDEEGRTFTDPADADTDDDGSNDGDEVNTGTDPNHEDSTPGNPEPSPDPQVGQIIDPLEGYPEPKPHCRRVPKESEWCPEEGEEQSEALPANSDFHVRNKLIRIGGTNEFKATSPDEPTQLVVDAKFDSTEADNPGKWWRLFHNDQRSSGT